MFNLQNYLEENFQVEVFNEENVTMPCVRCGKTNKHFLISINPQKKYCHCFKCGYKTSWAGLISQLKNISYEEAKGMVEDSYWIKPKIEKKIESIILPERESLSNNAWDYLISRKLTRELIWKYDLYLTRERPYYNRIVMPVYFKKEAVTFQARAINGNGLRYLSPKNSPIGMVLYNYDEIKINEPLIISEGVFDVLNLVKYGYNSVATFGKKISDSQISLLEKKGVRDVILMYDADAISKTKDVFLRLQGHFDVKIAPLLEGDPGDCQDFSYSFCNLIENLTDFNSFIMGKFKNKFDKGYKGVLEYC